MKSQPPQSEDWLDEIFTCDQEPYCSETGEVRHALCKHAKQAIIEGFRARLPSPRYYKEAVDIEDHWGMTETSIDRQIQNMKSSGFNECLEAVNQLLNELNGENYE